MARTKKRNRSDASDDAYNARRRYLRQAQRYEKQATQASTSIEAGRLRKLGSRALEHAINTYADPKEAKVSKPIANLQKSLGESRPLRRPSKSYQEKLIEDSEERATAKGMSAFARREYEASEIVTGQIGRRIYGAFSDVWKDADDREDALLKYFGAASMMDVIEEIEAAGIDIYADPESEVKYDEIRTALELAFGKQ